MPWLVPLCCALLAFTACSSREESHDETQQDRPVSGNAPAEAADSESSGLPDAKQIRERYLSWSQTGKAHYENRSAEQAVASFRQAADLLPGELAAHLNLARANLMAQSNREALANARQALELDSYSVAALYLCGLANLRLEQSAEAVSYLQRAVNLDPACAPLRFQLANALRLDGQATRADDELRAVLQLDPNHWSAHFQLADAARRAGDMELSRQHMQDYQRLFEQLPESEKVPDALERCKYTIPGIPAGVHQPPESTVDVRFDPTPLRNIIESAPVLVPVVVFDVDSDGQSSFLAIDSNSNLRVVRSSGQNLRSTKQAAAPLAATGSWRGRVADYNNDGRSDVFMFAAQAAKLLQQTNDFSFQDASDGAGIPNTGARDASWLDYDHDGDTDLLIADHNGQLKLFTNRGNGTFVDASEAAQLPKQLTGVVRVAAIDMDDDESIDIVFADEQGSISQLTNDGLGVFLLTDRNWPQGQLFVVEDIDNDLKRDVAIASGNRLFIETAGGKKFTLDMGQLIVRDIELFDHDNDGWLDLLIAGQVDNESRRPNLRLYRNCGAAGWQDITSRVGLEQVNIDPRGPMLAADLDNDGDSDLIATAGDGDGILYRNQGGHQHGQLKIRLRGTRSNRSGIGTLIEIRSGAFRLSRTVCEFPVEIGVAELEQLDSVKTIWPNGIVKNDIWVNTQQTLNIEEPFVSAGSCPYLYAFNGESFQFVTDILGASPLGLSLKRGMFVPANTNEIVWVGDHQTMQSYEDGYAIQIADELREILYLDHVELTVIDYPADCEAHSTTKLSPPPFTPSAIWTVGQKQNLIHAVDSGGIVWTDQLHAIDNKLTQPPRLRQPQLRGLADQHSLELEFEQLDTDQPLVLVMNGWLQWGDASVNIAASQNPDLPNPWPTLDAWSGNQWQNVNVTVGLPAGKTKTILVDLNNSLPAGTTKLRLTTGYEVYWDRISMFVRTEPKQMKRHRLPIESAELKWRGFPAQIRHSPRTPIVPDPGNISTSAPWRTLPMGWFTRYGDIVPLISQKDDQLAIFNGGDASIIKFSGSLPELPDGWRRDFFVQLDGWDKDSDYNVRCGDRVEPLPYHDMDEQRYGEQAEPETSPWTKRYNTRWCGPRLQ